MFQKRTSKVKNYINFFKATKIKRLVYTLSTQYISHFMQRTLQAKSIGFLSLVQYSSTLLFVDYTLKEDGSYLIGIDFVFSDLIVLEIFYIEHDVGASL